MATLDPSIILQARGVQDPLESYGKALSLKSLGNQQRMQENQLAQYDQEQQQAKTLADVYRGATNPSGGLDRNALYRGVASSGLGAKIPSLQEGFAKVDKQTADTRKTSVETQALGLKLIGDTVSQLASNPNVTHDQVIQAFALFPADIVPPEQTAQIVRSLPPDQAKLRQTLLMYGASADDRWRALKPELIEINNGKQITYADKNALTNPTGAGLSVQRTTTPGEDQQAATARAGQAVTMRGQDVARDAAQQGGSVQTDSHGNMIVVPNKFSPGAPVQSSVVIGSGGVPVKGKDGGGPKISAEVQRQIGGVISFDKDLSALEDALKDFNPRNPLDQGNTEKRARIQSLSKQAQLSAKEAAALGALSGPDMALLEGILNDPTSLRGAVSGSRGVAAQIAEARSGNKRRVSSLEQQYGSKASDGFPAELKTQAEPKANTQSSTFTDAEKERRYQEWKAKQK